MKPSVGPPVYISLLIELCVILVTHLILVGAPRFPNLYTIPTPNTYKSFSVGEKYGHAERSHVRAVTGGGWGSRCVQEATSRRAYGACRRSALASFPL